MLSAIKVCYACLETTNDQLTEVFNLDNDNITFIDKLKACISADLEEDHIKKLCVPCIEKLQNAYCFQQLVLYSQDVLRKQKITVEHSFLVESSLFEPLVIVNQNTQSFQHSTISYGRLPNSECQYAVLKNEDTSEHSQESVTYDTCITEDTPEVQYYETVGDHTNEYRCYHCSSVFYKRWKLRNHISDTHSRYKKSTCTYCNKNFKQAYHLREHLTTHTGERNFTCSFCCKSFQRVSSMHRHLRSHEKAPGEKTKKTPFLCTVCGKKFPFSNGVQRHMRIHSGVRNHQCHICLRRFSQTTHLHVHMRTHTGEKPYVCETCGETFSLNASLQKHLSIHKVK